MEVALVSTCANNKCSRNINCLLVLAMLTMLTTSTNLATAVIPLTTT